MRDTTGNKAPREILYMVNASLSLFRLIIVFALSIGGVCLQADANRANLQAPLLGKHTYIRLPRNFWPSWWHDKFWNPVMLLYKALYGLYRSGFDWDAFSRAKLQALGSPVRDSPVFLPPTVLCAQPLG